MEFYEELAGYKYGERCSRRDLPGELAKALTKYGIRLMLYLPSRSPQQDEKAMKNLKDVHERQPAPQEFTRNWSDVIRKWSVRYGTQISGWWFDGSYSREGWDDLSKPYNWNTWAAACRAGNPNSLLAFNPEPIFRWRSAGSARSRITRQANKTHLTSHRKPIPHRRVFNGIFSRTWGAVGRKRTAPLARMKR
jgi:hypothetical protein